MYNSLIFSPVLGYAFLFPGVRFFPYVCLRDFFLKAFLFDKQDVFILMWCLEIVCMSPENMQFFLGSSFRCIDFSVCIWLLSLKLSMAVAGLLALVSL